ncbi:coiled-coil domain-containing 93 [Brachionus plicatilis]|uniref:Coiled-coil domain-containing protein 93 n=1 Tax=Brachionus plicatilis TaxID=10195 RepID=A0A3M7PIB9_BRAPC|nr:coiled-coil domain-containing 93 [Brachionus plicatilis]
MSKFSSKFYNAPTDQSGRQIQFDVREDEEQQTKLQETVELLVAAGYFRARIKGLSAFDKIVGGMTWCITTCNFDVDVDLLFQESSTIGQKIALVERIVSVLPRMKCPHRIEPHQIQGLDFIHVFPVMQWLVKKAIETRAEMGDMNRSFAISQFEKMRSKDADDLEASRKNVAMKFLNNLREQNAPERKFVRKDLDKIKDPEAKIQSTLLEYGQQNILLSNIANQQQTQAQGSKQNKQEKEAKTGVATEEEQNIKKLIDEMTEADQKQNKLNANAVGQILGLQQSTLQQIVTDFSNKENELQNEIEQLEKLAASGDSPAGGLQHKQRLINILRRQAEQKERQIDEQKSELDTLFQDLENKNKELEKLLNDEKNLEQELVNLEDYEKSADKKNVQQLEELVKEYDKLRQLEVGFKKNCKEEAELIQKEIENLEKKAFMGENLEEKEKIDKINEQYETAKAKLQTLRLKVARKNREISTLKRKLDEIPSKSELTQYQKRFIELYNQLSTGYVQTKQFYILYNVLEDKKFHINKVITLYNSIYDQFKQAMSSPSNRDQFVKQLDAILEGVKNNVIKVENKKIKAKSDLDALNDQYIDLIEKKRLYFKTIKDFQEECKKNENFLSTTQ